MTMRRRWWALVIAVGCGAGPQAPRPAEAPSSAAAASIETAAPLPAALDAHPITAPVAAPALGPLCQGRPHAPHPSKRDVRTPAACRLRAREVARGGWAVELAGEGLQPHSDGGTVWLWSERCWYALPGDGPVPHTAGRPFDVLDWADFDTDGTVVFNGRWSGHPDQVNGVGVGLYRLEGRTPRPIVDAFTAIPGQSMRFNQFGIPDIDGGRVAFYASRGGHEWGGVYLWTPDALIPIADTSTPVVGTGTPTLRSGEVVFQGEEHGRPGFYRWTLRDRQLTRLLGVGDPVPDDPSARIDLLFDQAVGDGIVYASVRAGAENLILGWHDGAVFTVARAAWLRSGHSQPPMIQTTLSADGGAVAFTAGIGADIDLWVAEGCAIERVASTGDAASGSLIQNLNFPAMRGLVGHAVDIEARLADGRDVRLLARRRTP